MSDAVLNGGPDGNEGMSSGPEVCTIVVYDYGANITRILCSEQDSLSPDCPENTATDLFREFARQNPREAAEYLTGYIDFIAAKGVLGDQTALMFIGVIYFCLINDVPGYPDQTRTFNEWKSLSQEIAEKKKARQYSTASRVALCGGILTLMCMVAEDTSDMARQLESHFKDLYNALRASSPGEGKKVDYLGEHFLRAMEDLRYGEGSPISAFLKRISGK